MLSVECQGSPYELGRQHGSTAKDQVHGSIAFYKRLFHNSAQLDWSQVRREAVKFLPYIKQPAWTPLMEEMEGIAAGAEVDFEDILALNVRTEIAYGMFSDGCTSIAWKAQGTSFLAQNWDWDIEQSPNLIALRIVPSPPSHLPRIHMITEAGIIGKIGLNSAGVGVTLNAIKARGVDFAQLPCHLALRTALNSSSCTEAVARLTKVGVASACHITIADATTGGIGLECSHKDIVPIAMSDAGVCTHTNHFLEEHAPGVVDSHLVEDSPTRLERIRTLVAQEGTDAAPNFERIERYLQDEEGYPYSIYRARASDSTFETLFGICMDLTEKKATVAIGVPVEKGKQKLELRP
ncbi:isopenicillin-N N-acyltransferase [Coniochaeta ligniaria NRRL 30616]|uniref:Isopenicillin-N N-acyltransferase n=1 Tax=Coniochaeta ligniaria NRRL 30616 TaxID=1408157 RepID=A0A1J7JD11_9PEZI|nr:isopenicillin-N N-acyltransferase [Coniochaeta ligniaria NRRL 30616]